MFKFPDDVPGWLTIGEGRKLADLARGKLVLELGSYKGRSTICMAQTAACVVSVDWHKGDQGSGFGDTEVEFRDNLRRYGVGNVEVHVCRTEAYKSAERFDLIFIDGAHDYDAVCTDLAIALRYLKPGGTIAMHDWNYPQVRQAHRDVLGEEWRGSCIDNLRWSSKQAPSTKPRVFLGMPRYSDNVALGAARAFYFPTRGACEVVQSEKSSPRISLLDHCFNQIWAAALDSRDDGIATHFAMIHADIAADAGWLDDLYEELTRLDADMVSAVVPIKNNCGLTSTALDTGDVFTEGGSWVPRRLTKKEVAQLPETFGAEDVGCPLLLNTGLWICDLRKPWADKVCFDSMKRIVRGTDGRRTAQCVSEDWLFSNALNQLEAKLYATSKVRLLHHGDGEFKNWIEDGGTGGRWQTDELFEKHTGKTNEPIGAVACA